MTTVSNDPCKQLACKLQKCLQGLYSLIFIELYSQNIFFLTSCLEKEMLIAVTHIRKFKNEKHFVENILFL